MSEIMVRERFLRSGKKVYEYSFEMASVDGKRKRKSKSGFASKRDARIAGRKALSEYENVGQVMVDRDISYADFLDLWMENDCKLTCKENTSTIASLPEPTFAEPFESILKSMTSDSIVPAFVISAISIGSSIFLPSVKYSIYDMFEINEI